MSKYYLVLIFLLAMVSCRKEAPVPPGFELEDWTNNTHAGDATPNYDIVFPNDKVNRFDIVIEPEYWEVLQNNLNEVLGSGGFATETPTYVPSQVYFNGRQWYDVGFRFKGNSSLSSAYNTGKSKFPIRLEFNHFEDENPLIRGQSFYGFQQLSLANSFKDYSLMREKAADDVFREFGIPTAKAAFYRVYVDHGNGPEYYGLYTGVEIVFDTMIKSQFGTDAGICFKAEGDHANGHAGGATFNYIHFMEDYEKDFELKGDVQSDMSELINMFTALHDSRRLTDPALWRSNLEAVFNVDGFLKWLAANTTVQNWDTYGLAPHNYYLYYNPEDTRIHWIPWDHNECFINSTTMVHAARDPLPFDFSGTGPGSIGPNWPLIRFLYDDPTYKTAYDNYIDQFINGPFEPSKMAANYNDMYNLIQPFVTGSEGEVIPEFSFLNNYSDFDASLTELINHCNVRYAEADAYTP